MFQAAQKIEFFDGDLDGQFPEGGFANPKFIDWTFQRFAGDLGKGRILVAMPDEGVTIDEKFHRMYS